MSLIVTIDGHQYDVEGFIPDHPGEKPQKNKSITKYPNQDITEVFKAAHAKAPRHDLAEKILTQARENGECDGVKYLGCIVDSIVDSISDNTEKTDE